MTTPIKYEVFSMIGDYILDDQLNWGKKYRTLPKAIKAAYKHHKKMLEKLADRFETDPDHVYTIVVDDSDDKDIVYFMIYQNKEYRGPEAQVLADLIGTE